MIRSLNAAASWQTRLDDDSIVYTKKYVINKRQSHIRRWLARRWAKSIIKERLQFRVGILADSILTKANSLALSTYLRIGFDCMLFAAVAFAASAVASFDEWLLLHGSALVDWWVAAFLKTYHLSTSDAIVVSIPKVNTFLSLFLWS